MYEVTIGWHVDHRRGTAARQAGIYDVLDELPREAVDWVAEACCVDSPCLRRRTSVDHPRVRRRTHLRTRANADERNQLEELIDAVAEGRTDEIREAAVDDGANRYQARYLRAKRFDEDGSLEIREQSTASDPE